MTSRFVRTLLVLAALVPSLAAQNDSIAILKGETLVIEGSAGIDELYLRIADRAVDGDDPAVSVEIEPGTGSTVNGSVEPAVFDGVRKLRVSLGDGADYLYFDAFEFGKNPMLLDLGAGDDEVVVGETKAGAIKVIAGAGNDTVRFPFCNVGATRVSDSSGALYMLAAFGTFEQLKVTSGPESDEVWFENIEVALHLALDTGDGDDQIDIPYCSVAGKAVFKLGPGNNRFTSTGALLGKSAVIMASDGDDEVDLGHWNVGTSLSARLGAGQNTFSLVTEPDPASIGDDLRYTGGGEDDIVDIHAYPIGHDARIVLKGGANAVTLTDCSIGKDLRVSAGAGDDSVQLPGTTIGGKQLIQLDGGNNTEP